MKEVAVAGLRKQIVVRAVLLQEGLQYIGWGSQKIVTVCALAESEARSIAEPIFTGRDEGQRVMIQCDFQNVMRR